MHVTDLAAAFSRIQSSWNPHIVGQLSGQLVKVAKLRGEFIHRQEAEDELFQVDRGTRMIRLRDRSLRLGPRQFCIIPRGVEHQPVAEAEVEVVLFEPASTLNTGNVRNELTRVALKTLEA